MSLLPNQILPQSEPIGTVADDGKTVMMSHNWYLLQYNIASKALGGAGSAPTPDAITVTPTGSPFTYTAPSTGTLSVTGGANLSLTLARGAVSAPVAAGLIPMVGTDMLKVSYTIAPQMVFFPFSNTSA